MVKPQFRSKTASLAVSESCSQQMTYKDVCGGKLVY